MSTYEFLPLVTPPHFGLNEVFLIASGDSRLPANQICWPAQKAADGYERLQISSD